MINKKEVIFLKKAYKKERDAKVKERMLMMIYYFQGNTLRGVAEKLNCDHKLVLFWKRRYVSEGLKGLKTRQKSGKQRLISRRQEANLKKIIGNNPEKAWTTRRVYNLILEKTEVSYSQRHVTRILNRWNLGLSSGRPIYWKRATDEEIKLFGKKNILL
jgi:transposase